MFAATGHQASWTLYAVSQEAAVEAKITEELASLGLLATSKSPQPRQLEWDDLKLLTYLNAVIKVPPAYCKQDPRCLHQVPFGGHAHPLQRLKGCKRVEVKYACYW